MLRLTLLLCLGMYAALMTLGEDRGQLRPGLAKAVAEGRLATGRDGAEDLGIEVAAASPEPAAIVATAPEPVAEATPTPEPRVEAPAPTELAALTPEPEADPATSPLPAPVSDQPVDLAEGREVVEVLDDPVFSLANLGNEPVPGEEGTTVEEPEVVSDAEIEADPAESSGGAVWYINASSVNVRAEPSTEAAILDKLNTGEAALVVAQVDDEWARIVIEGDGVEGYVALRFLSPEAP